MKEWGNCLAISHPPAWGGGRKSTDKFIERFISIAGLSQSDNYSGTFGYNVHDLEPSDAW